MILSQGFRQAIARLFYYPFVAWTATRYTVSSLCHPRRFAGKEAGRDEHSGSLAYTGMSGDFSGTVVTLFVKREGVQSALPPELTTVENDELPDWLQQRDDHPVILLIGKQANLGKRRPILGRHRTVPLFAPYLETFVAIPFVRPRGPEGPRPCFHFTRVACDTFWPTELGILSMGWPKMQCPMQMSQQGQMLHYSIQDERGKHPLLSAQTDLTDPLALDASQASLGEVRSMLAQPLVLIKGRKLLFFSFDLRFEAATLKAVSASGTIYPGLLPAIAEPMEFSSPKITDGRFGAFLLETKFMNRLLEEVEAPPQPSKRHLPDTA